MSAEDPTGDDPERPPRVLLSYSHDSPEHARRVLELAQRMRQEGIDAIIDQFDDAPAEGWPRWMLRQIREADYIVVIASDGYRAKCEGELPRGQGRGVKWESHLTLQELYDDDGYNYRYVPVIFDDATEREVPRPLAASTIYKLPQQYDDLYRRLTGQKKVLPMPVGQRRAMPVLSGAGNEAAPASQPSPSSTPLPSTIETLAGLPPISIVPEPPAPTSKTPKIVAGVVGGVLLLVLIYMAIPGSGPGDRVVDSDPVTDSVAEPLVASVPEPTAGTTTGEAADPGATATTDTTDTTTDTAAVGELTGEPTGDAATTDTAQPDNPPVETQPQPTKAHTGTSSGGTCSSEVASQLLGAMVQAGHSCEGRMKFTIDRSGEVSGGPLDGT
ncbi:MAG: TIR domain-containing protein, partial [Myxococcales bacterium]|nr:TIR domain-containing protein [Myxococcales bacterium]